jgi:hypothetical protein
METRDPHISWLASKDEVCDEMMAADGERGCSSAEICLLMPRACHRLLVEDVESARLICTAMRMYPLPREDIIARMPQAVPVVVRQMRAMVERWEDVLTLLQRS